MFWKVNTATESWEIGKNPKDGIFAGASTVGGRTGCDPPEAEVAAVREQEHWALRKEQTAPGEGTEQMKLLGFSHYESTRCDICPILGDRKGVDDSV